MTTSDIKSLLPLRPADLQILMLLTEQPLHAYGISKAADEAGPGAVRLEIGSLYRTLNRLRTEGLIDELEGEASGPQNQPRRMYRITARGRDLVRAEAERLEAVVAMARERDFLPDSSGN